MLRALVAACFCLFLFSGPSAAQTLQLDTFIKALGDAVETTSKPITSQPATSTPQFSRNERRAIQRDLNTLGFGAGAADGIFGNRTRNAIAQFQSSIGTRQTGNLSLTERQQLAQLASGSAVAPSENSTAGASFEILQNFDLPGNDYRHSGTDSSLKGLSASQCQWACDQDGRCAAYTYNSKARWCFLKQAVAPREAFGGAISGIKQSTAALPSLASLGLADGGGDAFSASDFNDADYLPEAKPDGFDLALELSLRAIYAQPDLLRSDKRVADWLSDELPRWDYGEGEPKATPLTIKFHDGTSFDRADAVATFREQLKARAVNTPLRHSFSQQVFVRPDLFDPAKGIPVFATGGNVRPDVSVHELFLEYLGERTTAQFENAPDVSFMPIFDEEEVRKLAELLRVNEYNRIRLRRYITYTDIAFQTSSSGYGFASDGTLDKVDLYIEPRKNSEIDTPLVLYTWATAEQRVGAGESAIAFAQWAGIPILAGRYAVFRGMMFGDVFGLDKLVESANQGWSLLKVFSYLQMNPEILDDNETLIFFARLTLSDKQKEVVSRGKPLFKTRSLDARGLDAYDEFEGRAVIRDLRENYSDQILSYAPTFPVPVIEVTHARLGEYNFDYGNFPIVYKDDGGRSSWGRGASRIAEIFAADNKYSGSSEVSFDLGELPSELSISESDAPKLLDFLRSRFPYSEHGSPNINQARDIYVVVLGTMELVGDGAEPTYRVKQDRLVIYAEPTMKNLIAEFDVADFSSETLAKREAERQSAQAEAEAAAEGERVAAENEQAELERLARMVQFEDRALDILGVRPGMTTERAKQILSEAYGSSNVRVNDGGGGGGSLALSPCGVQQSRYKRDILLDIRAIENAAAADGRETLNETEQQQAASIRSEALAGMTPECVAEFFGDVELAFSMKVSYESGLGERIGVFEAVHPDYSGRVVAIVRSFEGNTEELGLIENLGAKYGATFFQMTGADAYWFERAEVHNQVVENEAYRDACVARTPWPTSGVSLQPSYFGMDCGDYVGVLNDKMFLVDTGALMAVRQSAEEYLAARKAEINERQPVKF